MRIIPSLIPLVDTYYLSCDIPSVRGLARVRVVFAKAKAKGHHPRRPVVLAETFLWKTYDDKRVYGSQAAMHLETKRKGQHADIRI
jgi:hypothetical protein